MNPTNARRGPPLRVTALVDAFVTPTALETRKGPRAHWYDANVIDQLRALGHDVSLVQFSGGEQRVADSILAAKPDVVFNLSQGMFEDGAEEYRVAEILEKLRVPYTGAGPHALRISRDKLEMKSQLKAAGVTVAAAAAFPGAEASEVRSIRFPLIVKPRFGGGSQGITRQSIVHRSSDAMKTLRERHRTLRVPLIAEEFIDGRELSVGIVEDGRLRTMAAWEWHFGHPTAPRFVTEHTKWQKRYRDRWNIRFQPAELDEATRLRVSRAACRAFRALGLRDYGAIDLRLTPDGRLVLLDVNANPGLYCQYGRWSGMRFDRLINRIVTNAFTRGADAETE